MPKVPFQALSDHDYNFKTVVFKAKSGTSRPKKPPGDSGCIFGTKFVKILTLSSNS